MLKILLKYCNKFNFGWLCPEVFSQIKPQSFITAAEQGPVHIFNIRLELVTTFISSNKCLYSWLDLKIFNTNHSVYEISSQLHDSLKVMNFCQLLNILYLKLSSQRKKIFFSKDWNFCRMPMKILVMFSSTLQSQIMRSVIKLISQKHKISRTSSMRIWHK